MPPIAVDARILVADAATTSTAGYLNAYRILISDLVVLDGGGSRPRRDRGR